MFNIFLHTVYTCIKIVRILLLLGWTIKNILLRRLLKIFRYVTEKRGRKREGERERERERQNTTEWFYIKKQICNYYFKTIFTNNIPTITPNLSLKKSFLCGGDVLRKRNASRMRGLFSIPDGYALTRYNVLSKVHADVCVTRDYTRDGHATSSCLTSCVYFTFSFRLFACLPSSPLIKSS